MTSVFVYIGYCHTFPEERHPSCVMEERISFNPEYRHPNNIMNTKIVFTDIRYSISPKSAYIDSIATNDMVYIMFIPEISRSERRKNNNGRIM